MRFWYHIQVTFGLNTGYNFIAETYNFKYETNPKKTHYISFVGFEEVLSQHWNYFSLKFFDDDVSGVEN